MTPVARLPRNLQQSPTISGDPYQAMSVVTAGSTPAPGLSCAADHRDRRFVAPATRADRRNRCSGPIIAFCDQQARPSFPRLFYNPFAHWISSYNAQELLVREKNVDKKGTYFADYPCSVPGKNAPHCQFPESREHFCHSNRSWQKREATDRSAPMRGRVDARRLRKTGHSRSCGREKPKHLLTRL